MSSFQYTNSGLNNAAEYVASGMPWVSTSIGISTASNVITFPYVTSEIYLHASGGNARFGFTDNGVNGTNYFIVNPTDGTTTFKIRCTKLYVRADTGAVTLSIGASLTGIQGKSMPLLSQSYADLSTGMVSPIGITGSAVPVFGYNGIG